MRSLTISTSFLLILLVQNALGAVGFFAFGVDYDQSGVEFKQKVAEYRMTAKADGISKHFVGKNDFIYRTSAFYVSHNARLRIPSMLAELRNSLCFLDPFFVPIRETRLGGASHMRNDTLLTFVAPSHRRLREHLLDALTRYGMLPFEEEHTEKYRGEQRSPNVIIAASIPIEVKDREDPMQFPAMDTGKLVTEVKLNQYVTVYECENNWSDMDCEAVKSDFIMTPCKN